MARSRSRSSGGASDNTERLEPLLLRAAENDDVDTLNKIVLTARANGQMSDNFMRIGLMRSAEKGKIQATQYLLSAGAPTDSPSSSRLSPLMRAVERNHIRIAQLLLDYGADT